MKNTVLLLVMLISLAAKMKVYAQNSYDVIVYGGTSSGLIAAYAAAKEGLKVAVIEPGRHVGGLTASGLGSVDVGFKETIGGFTLDFFNRVGAHYGKNEPVFKLEPSVAEKVFLEMAEETGIKIHYNSRLNRNSGVLKSNGKINRITLENKKVYAAKVFIDATYEGDLMAAAGVSYIVGRESSDKYNESEAGKGKRGYSAVKLNDKQLGEIRRLATEFPLDFLFGEVGDMEEGDDKTQAYTFRVTATNRDEIKVPFPRPEHYNPERYDELRRRILQNKLETFDQVCTIYHLPNGKVDINHLDLPNASHGYPDGTYAEREFIWKYHRDYQMGYLYFVCNDSGVPEKMRADAQKWGLAKDEFIDNNNWPYTLYIREGRRMIGTYVMKQQDSWENIYKKDVIGMGSYFLDSHIVQRTINADNYLVKEGHLRHVPFRPYQIPYMSLVPNENECSNLLVPVCLSASHVMYSSLRMEPVYMITGHAAGIAASIAARKECSVQDINIKLLQRKLRSQGQIFNYKPHPLAYLPKEKYKGVIVDNTEALVTGKWSRGYRACPFLMADYIYTKQTENEEASVTFKPKLEKSGYYNVFIMYNPEISRTAKAKIEIFSKKGKDVEYVDMTKPGPDSMEWVLIGQYEFEKESEGKIVISNEGTGGIVIADAIRFERIKKNQFKPKP